MSSHFPSEQKCVSFLCLTTASPSRPRAPSLRSCPRADPRQILAFTLGDYWIFNFRPMLNSTCNKIREILTTVMKMEGSVEEGHGDVAAAAGWKLRNAL